MALAPCAMVAFRGTAIDERIAVLVSDPAGSRRHPLPVLQRRNGSSDPSAH